MIDKIMAYEQGELDANGTLELFSELVKTGMAWTLQGSYGRAAMGMIQRGWLDENGNILRSFDDD